MSPLGGTDYCPTPVGGLQKGRKDEKMKGRRYFYPEERKYNIYVSEMDWETEIIIHAPIFCRPRWNQSSWGWQYSGENSCGENHTRFTQPFVIDCNILLWVTCGRSFIYYYFPCRENKPSEMSLSTETVSSYTTHTPKLIQFSRGSHARGPINRGNSFLGMLLQLCHWLLFIYDGLVLCWLCPSCHD